MTLLLTADRRWDGHVLHEGGQAVVADGDRIAYTGPLAGLPPLPPDTPREDLGDATLLPGLIDVHAHVTFGTGNRTYEQVMDGDSDVLMMLRGVHNLQRHLAAGVTTLRDCGARGRTAIELALAANSGAFPAPRLLTSGPPITPTKGHFWWCGGEADGVAAIRQAALDRFAQGADFLKIMASGGGTAGTDASTVTYAAEEIAAATAVARELGRLTTAHCLASGAIEAAVRGGIHQVEHINFIEPDGSRRWDERTAQLVIDHGVVVSPTIQTGYRQIERLEQADRTPEQTRILDGLQEKMDTKLEFVRRFRDLGATIVAGTDAIQVFGDYVIGLRLLRRAGLAEREVLVAATSAAARAIGLPGEVGELKAGACADLLAVPGDPAADLGVLERPILVARAGRLVARGNALLL